MPPLDKIKKYKAEADLILQKYPDIYELAKPYEDLQTLITLYYVEEYKYYPKIEEENIYPHNIPEWDKDKIIQLLNEYIAKKTSEGWIGWAVSSVVGNYTVESYLGKEDIDKLFDLFKNFVKQVKRYAYKSKYAK